MIGELSCRAAHRRARGGGRRRALAGDEGEDDDAMKGKKREEAKGALVWQLRRRWGMAAIRGNARLILDRMQFVEYGGRADSQVAKMRGCPRRAFRRERALELSWFGPSIGDTVRSAATRWA